MVCRENLFRCIRCAHAAVVTCAGCIFDDVTEEEKEILRDIGLALSQQLEN